jgi:hypothetical protein
VNPLGSFTAQNTAQSHSATTAESALRQEYDALRQRLEWLLSQPEKDLSEVDRLVDLLERTQLRLKDEFGIKGNNPIE